MITLGIETSCDETALCLLETKGEYPVLEYRVLSHIIHSQAEMHSKYGGVFPMMAKREHAKRLAPLLEQSIKESAIATEAFEASSTDLENIKKICGEHDEDLYQSIIASSLIKEKPAVDRIAVTHGPGLEPALWVGINFANALSSLWKVPVIGINHMEGHVVAGLLPKTETKYAFESLIECSFPAMAFLISGGHTEIVYVKEIGHYEVLGATRDDAIGEAFDKVARMLGLPYPGGPEISRLAEMERKQNQKIEVGSVSVIPAKAVYRCRLFRRPGILSKDKVSHNDSSIGNEELDVIQDSRFHGNDKKSRNSNDALAQNDSSAATQDERRLFRHERSDMRKSTSVVVGGAGQKIILPRPMINTDTLDMSFAGLKTAVLYELRKHEKIDEPLKKEVAREFEDAVTDVIIAKLERAFDAHEAHSLVVGGGVLANKHILKACKTFSARRGIAFLPPAVGLSGDNALMIAVAGAINEKSMPSTTIGGESDQITAQGNLSL
jgi:tRNA A37 threonylcarbamoyltransferase TsaD